MGLGYLLVRIWLSESGGFLPGSVCEAKNYRACTGKYPQFLRPSVGRWIYSHDDRGGRLAGALSEYEA